jgi:hypothetical protein
MMDFERAYYLTSFYDWNMTLSMPVSFGSGQTAPACRLIATITLVITKQDTATKLNDRERHASRRRAKSPTLIDTIPPRKAVPDQGKWQDHPSLSGRQASPRDKTPRLP